MKSKLTLQILIPCLAAAIALLAVWFLPLPDPIFGSEQLAAKNMPQTRVEANAAIARFDMARQAYYDFINAHDMSVISQTVRADLAQAQANPSDQAAISALHDQAALVTNFTQLLYGYAQAGDDLFPVLQNYDDQLMAYTRAETPPNDTVRAMTFPLADTLRLYPPPIGTFLPDSIWVRATVVKAQLDSLTKHTSELSGNLDGASLPNVISSVKQDVDDIWASGASVQNVGFQHEKYIDVLLKYDQNFTYYLQNGGGNTALTTGRKALAMALNIVVGLALAAGLAFLLMPRLRPQKRGAAT